MTFLWVALGSMIGSVLRWQLSLLLLQAQNVLFPWGSFIANLLGCLAMGACAGFFATGAFLPKRRALAAFVMPGLLGGFTTFSLFSLDVLFLMQQAREMLALLYVLVSGMAWLFSVWLGYYFFSALTGRQGDAT